MLRKALNTLILMRVVTDGAAAQRVTFKPGEIVDLSREELDTLSRIDPECVGVLSEADIALYEARNAKVGQETVLTDDDQGELAPLDEPPVEEKPKAKGKGKAAPAGEKAESDDGEL